MERPVIEVLVVVIVKRGNHPMSDIRGVGLDSADRISIDDTSNMAASR